MEKTGNVLEQNQERRNTLFLPFLIALIGVLIMGVSLFLPYMTAVGDIAEYIEQYPDRVEIEDLELTASDLANIPVVSVSNIITGVYGEDDGTIANVIVLVFGGLLVLTALFVILKKPIAVMIFDLLAGGVFFFLNFLMKEDFIAADKYAWGIGYYATMIAAVVIFAGAVYLLVEKIKVKKQKKVLQSPNIQ